LVGTLITAGLGVERLLGRTGLSDRPLLFLGILLVIVGTQFITMGLLGEMLSRVYHEGQDKPVYVIRDVLTSAERETTPIRSGMRGLSAPLG
jgi:hypothetical protein